MGNCVLSRPNKILKVTQVWLNSAPNVSFGAQTINLSLSSYVLIQVIFKIHANIDTYLSYIAAANSLEYNVSGFSTSVSNGPFFRRMKINTSDIVFSDSNIDNTILVPFRVNGIK